jgi:hypothetical protein
VVNRSLAERIGILEARLDQMKAAAATPASPPVPVEAAEPAAEVSAVPEPPAPPQPQPLPAPVILPDAPAAIGEST